MREKDIFPLIKEKLGIEELNDMQRRMLSASTEKRDVMLLSPTGTGKTLAYTLHLLKNLRPASGRPQVVVMAPSRELVMQIAGVVGKLAAGYKVTPLYGGHKVEDEVNSLQAGTDIVIATPGRLLDHIRRRNIDVLGVRICVLDEFDKMVELGFEEEMRKILNRMKNVSRLILTSATHAASLPEFIRLDNPLEIDFSGEEREVRRRQKVSVVRCGDRDKLQSLWRLLCYRGHDGKARRSIIFVNHRESVDRVAEFLRSKGVDCVAYHGALDQRERETAMALFNSGSRPVLIATDLAARGLDIENVEDVIHYHQPLTPATYTHRNGRTARVDTEGDIYLLLGPDEEVKDFVEADNEMPEPQDVVAGPLRSGLATLAFSAGRREKLSKGDILGFMVKMAGLEPSDIGIIFVADHYALAAVNAAKAGDVIAASRREKIKGEKRKVSLVG